MRKINALQISTLIKLRLLSRKSLNYSSIKRENRSNDSPKDEM